jgi:hypothetical protein
MKDVAIRTPQRAPATPAPEDSAPRVRVPLELLRERNPKPAALARAGFGTIEQLYDAVAVQFQLPRLALDTVELSLELVNLLPQAIAVKHRIVLVFASAQEISVAASDPTQLQLFDWLARQHKRVVTVVIATPAEIERAQARLY